MAWPLIRQPVRIRNCWQLLLVPLFTRPAAPRPAVPASTSPSKPGRPRVYGGVRRTACSAVMQCGPPSRVTYYNAVSGKGKVAGKRVWRLRTHRPRPEQGLYGLLHPVARDARCAGHKVQRPCRACCCRGRADVFFQMRGEGGRDVWGHRVRGTARLRHLHAGRTVHQGDAGRPGRIPMDAQPGSSQGQDG